MTCHVSTAGRRQVARRPCRAITVLATLLGVLGALLAAGCGGGGQPAGSASPSPVSALSSLARHAPGPAYYLALGDSLSVGLQPGPDGRNRLTEDGYPRQLAAMLGRHVPGLKLAVLGCSGETTSSMIRGGYCRYPAGSQLAQAREFLRGHRGQVVLITIDIGANDPNSCALASDLKAPPRCLTKNLATANRNLRTMLRELRAAAGPGVLIVGMNYYVPELALWLNGRNGSELAVVSERLALGFGRQLSQVYRDSGARVADVFGAFASADFTGRVRVPGIGKLPRNVARICSLTWMCADPPVGPNEHANAAGYKVIATAFWRAIAS